MAALALFLVGSVALDLASIDVTSLAILAGLVALAALILIRLLLAFRGARQPSPSWQLTYVNHTYVTYAPLSEAFHRRVKRRSSNLQIHLGRVVAGRGRAPPTLRMVGGEVGPIQDLFPWRTGANLGRDSEP